MSQAEAAAGRHADADVTADPAEPVAGPRLAIDRFASVFTDPAVEQAYRSRGFVHQRKADQAVLMWGAVMCFGMALSDFFVKAGTPVVVPLMLLRASLAGAGLLFLALSRYATPETLQRHFLAQGSFLFGWLLLLRMLYANREPWGLIDFLLIAAAFCLGLPVTVRVAAIFSALAASSYGIKTWFDPLNDLEPGTRPLVFAMTLVTVVLLLGQVVRLNRAARTQYASELLERENAALLSHQRSVAEAARAAAESAARAEAEFLATMSHEIRTPLNGMIGMLQLLDTTPLSAQQRDHVDTLHASADTLLGVVNDILDYSRAEAGEIPLDHGAFDPVDMVRQVTALFASQAQSRNIDLKTQLAELPEPRLGDVRRLRQILLNLVGNALKFTERGSITVSLARKPNSDWLRFAVLDTGIGISAQAQTRLFRKFSQADSSVMRRFGGTGLGLAISKRFVEAMGGEIGVDSTPGRGSCFWFEVELAPAPRAAVPCAVASNPATPRSEPVVPEGNVQPQRILLVEDVALNQKVAIGLLQTRGHSVTVANDGQEALSRLAGEDFDLVFMDLHMPRMDGLTATRQLREGGGRQAAVPVIGLTASVLDIDRARCLEAGMDDVITKPFSLASLDRAIRGAPARKTAPR